MALSEKTVDGREVDACRRIDDRIGANGSYSVERACPHCEFTTTSRDDYWRHYFDEHEDAA